MTILEMADGEQRTKAATTECRCPISTAFETNSFPAVVTRSRLRRRTVAFEPSTPVIVKLCESSAELAGTLD
jgi:hypothetical protein